jgi:CheY-like chemotaxis protein
LQIHLDLRASRDVVIADRGHLQQAFANLAHNARDAMPNGGSLVLATALVETGSGRMLEIRSTDTGVGIPPELLPHIFEPFFTTKKGGRGTGLGLASVWGTVQRHGGSIAVESHANQGTEFRIRLPLAPEGVEADRSNKGVHPVHSPRRLKIMALDDDKEVREALEAMIVAQGHQIELFSEFNGLWKRMKDGSNLDLLVLDLEMPSVDGIDALRRIRVSFPELPVLVASGHMTTSAMQELKNLGVETFLRKPFGAQDLGQALDRASSRNRI